MEQNENYLFSVEDALEMVLMFGQEGAISYANNSAKNQLEFGDDLLGRHISEVFPNTFQAAEDGFDTEYPFGEEVQSLVAYRKNRTCFPVETRIMQGPGDSGQYICMAIDVLEKEHLNREVEQVRQEAEQAMKVKSEFVANVTHELRTPVNGILGNAKELLAEDIDERTERTLRVIERCCSDMYKIMNNILDFSKLEAGKFTLENREFDFRNMMDYVKKNHSNKITEKGLEFFVTISPKVPEHIIGIDQADRDKLFQSFSQVDASISRKYGGTGLGLNICKQLVEMMGGSIEVESKKNQGSTFSFSIWAGVKEEEASVSQDDIVLSMPSMQGAFSVEEEQDSSRIYGTRENRETLERTLSKLILCVEMENWEKAEMFMETVRQLTAEAPPEVKRVILRLKMAIQKENYDKIMSGYEEISQMLQ